MSSTVSAQPEALRRLALVGLEMDGELSRAQRRLSDALAAYDPPPGTTRRLDLAAALGNLCRSHSTVDRWVGRVAAALAGADGGGLIGPVPAGLRVAAASAIPPSPSQWDELSDAEAVQLVRQIAARLEPALRHLDERTRQDLHTHLFELWARVRDRYPEATISRPCAALPGRPVGIDHALDILTVPDTTRHTDIMSGLLDGIVLGNFDTRGYDNVGAERARVLGHLASGWFAVGDARDFLADLASHRWVDSFLDAIGLAPLGGDAVKGTKELADVVETARDAKRSVARLEEVRGLEVIERGEVPGSLGFHEGVGHTLSRHSGRTDEQLAARLATRQKAQAVESTFTDDAVANAAVGQALRQHRGQISDWLSGSDGRLSWTADPGIGPVGRVLIRGEATAKPSSRVTVTLVRSDNDLGWIVLTAFPAL